MALPSSTYDTATLVNPTSSLTDFTLIVDLSRMSAAWWASVDTTDGTKGRAAKDSGPTELACDWIDFDNVAETGLLRVKWSGTLATTGTQTLRIYPPQAANASVAANATYGSDNAYDSDWAGYWPLHDEFDRTANGYDLTAQGGVTAGGVAGKIGAATDFDGTDDWFERTGTVPNTGPGKTLMAWVKYDTRNYVSRILEIQDSSTSSYQQLLHVLDLHRANEYDGTTQASSTSFAILSNGVWYHQAAQFITTTSRYSWRDGVRAGEGTISCDSTGDGTADRLGIGSSSTGGGTHMDAQIQHVQAHSVSRADEWIEYEYDQTNDQATFWGTWTNVPVAGTTTSSGALALGPLAMHYRRMMGVS